MDTMIAYCGLECDSCPIRLATLEKDEMRQQEMRESIARTCNEHYGMHLKPEDVNDCDGCLANTGRLFSGCLSCAIRKCVIGRNLESCADCPEYACDNLKTMFRSDPSAEARLNKIRIK